MLISVEEEFSEIQRCFFNLRKEEYVCNGYVRYIWAFSRQSDVFIVNVIYTIWVINVIIEAKLLLRKYHIVFKYFLVCRFKHRRNTKCLTLETPGKSYV